MRKTIASILILCVLISTTPVSATKKGLISSSTNHHDLTNNLEVLSSNDVWGDSIVSADILGENNLHTDPTEALGEPDYNSSTNTGFVSLGGGEIIIDMGEGEEILNGTGDDLIVYNPGTGTGETYEVYVSIFPSGEWQFLAAISGNGKVALNLDVVSLPEARYVRIVDTSIDTSSTTPGTEIDYVAAINCRNDPYADAVVYALATGSNNQNTDPTQALGMPDYDEDLDTGYFSLGQYGELILDMGLGEYVYDGDGMDLRVYNPGINDGEIANIYVSNAPNGPWGFVGIAYGYPTANDFDISSTGFSQIRYIKISDISTSDLVDTNPGTDVDYVEALYSGSTQSAWTIMYYQAADNNLEALAVEETNSIQTESITNPNINIAIFRDTLSGEAVYEAYVDGEMDQNIQKGELNTGDPTTLSDFVTWAKTNYPADHYALVIVDHGHGMNGVAQDKTSNPDDWLDPQNFRTALLSSGSFDVIFMEACLVGNIEHAYEARGQALYYVASEAIMVGPLSHNYLGEITGQTTARELAEAMALAYYEEVDGSDYSRTISVGDLSKIELVAEKLNTFASVIRVHKFDLGIAIWEIIRGDLVQRFDENNIAGIDDNDVLADLYHFAQLVGWLGEPDLTLAANNLTAAIDDYIVFNAVTDADNWDHSNAHGLSILLTKNRACYYVSDWFNFAGNVSWFCNDEIQEVTQENGEWGQMLSDYILEFNPEAISIYDPPPLVPLDILPQEVMIAIQPDGRPSTVRCTNDRITIEVAILTTDTFDALTVDHTTVTFEGATELHIDRKTHEPVRHEVDIDGDGDLDLVFHFRFGDTTLTCDSTEGTLIGETYDGILIEGTDRIRMTGG